MTRRLGLAGIFSLPIFPNNVNVTPDISKAHSLALALLLPAYSIDVDAMN
jgi:hypothetical protein